MTTAMDRVHAYGNVYHPSTSGINEVLDEERRWMYKAFCVMLQIAFEEAHRSNPDWVGPARNMIYEKFNHKMKDELRIPPK